MSRIASMLILLCAAASAGGFEWEEDVEAARKKAAGEWRPIFIFFAEMNKATRIIDEYVR